MWSRASSPLLGGLHEDPQVGLERFLADELVEAARPERRLVVLEERLGVQGVLLWRRFGETPPREP